MPTSSPITEESLVDFVASIPPVIASVPKGDDVMSLPLSGHLSISRTADDTCELTLTDTTSQLPVLICTITPEALMTALMGLASRPCKYTVTPSEHWGERLETQTVFLPVPEDSETLNHPEAFTMWLNDSIQSYTRNGWHVIGPADFNHHDWDRTQGYRVHLSRYRPSSPAK